MARIRVELPAALPFTTALTVRVTDLNYGGHVGNDTVLAFCQQARAGFLAALDYRELDVEGLGIIVADAAIQYRAEAFAGDRIEIAVAASDHNRRGCDFVYRLHRPADATEIARARTGIVFFDYRARRIAHAPEAFRRRLAERFPGGEGD